MTAIATYGGCTPNGGPATPGFGFETRYFNPWTGPRSCDSKRALQSQLKAMKRKEEPQTPATSAPKLGATLAPGKCESKTDGYAYGMPSSVKNTV
ncbi:hypothetical protein PI125_g11613 [Phytophthora idaei]|nr:hypothetical protein PI125_g11613 [Phytophthora idaei]KAG3140288.1 hypothetical protein PI126_g16076 [Phytophthora idaei]